MTGLRATLIGLGVTGMAYALFGALADPDLDPRGVAVFLTVVLVAHDALWMPVLLLVGAAVAKAMPRRPAVVRAALICGTTLTVVALPLVLGFGRPADNPSALPLPYGRNLLAILGALTALTVLGTVAGRRKKSESSREHGHRAADR